ncbi:hypothetical protein BDZ89DRAFT_1140734 [Hymenopellis radicata]|nr:hypothetical protein BDZ89DRAFT_1140734 [Hymenopellis radicata]
MYAHTHEEENCGVRVHFASGLEGRKTSDVRLGMTLLALSGAKAGTGMLLALNFMLDKVSKWPRAAALFLVWTMARPPIMAFVINCLSDIQPSRHCPFLSTPPASVHIITRMEWAVLAQRFDFTRRPLTPLRFDQWHRPSIALIATAVSLTADKCI